MGGRSIGEGQGLVLGLGLSFMGEGFKMMNGDLLLAIAAVTLTFIAFAHTRVPALLLLLGLGAIVALIRHPDLAGTLAQTPVTLALPSMALKTVEWRDVATGVVVLALPQAALTLGNAIVTTVDENNRLFPHRPTTVRAVAIDHGVMNLLGATFGAVPMCHGAGGMAAHVRFGARTGGALVMLGVVLVAVEVLFSGNVLVLLEAFPRAVLGTILMFGGLELASGAVAVTDERRARYVAAFTAAVAMWNMGAAYAAGLLLHEAERRGWVRL